MQLRTRKKWLKAAVLLAFSQFCFLTGTFQAQAEETTPSQPTVETTTPAPVEAVEVEPVEEAVPATETSAESVPETDAPTTNSKAVLDQTIGETQNPGDSPVCKQPIVVEPSETEDSGESLEEGDPSTTQPSESTEPMDTTEEMTAEDKTTSELSTSTEPSVGEIMDTSDVDTEKIVEKSTDNKDREAESTGKVVVASETKETTLSDKEVEDMFVVTQPRTTRARRATNTANVKMTEVAPKSTEGVYWAEMRLPNGTAFAYDKIDLFEVNGKVAFCIEPGVKGSSGTFTEAALDTYLKNAAVRKKIELIAYFGWEDSKDKSLHRRIATQLFIHEQLKSTPLMVNKVLNYEALKNEINQKIAIFNKKVSFAGKTETVKVGETITVTDKNNSLGNIKDITPSKGITAKIQGNQLVITATKDASEKATITLHKTKLNRTSLVYKQPGKQTISVLGDPTGREVILHLNVLKQGNLEIQKIDADTKKPLANAEIKVTINGKDQTVKTDKNGKAMIKNLTHGTKGSVVEVKAPTGYVLNKTSKDFTIEANKTIKVTIENKE
ncbi:SpaA isopeptide-forming pilin-related protein, partial [Enterococcus gallinarum]|uniref:SpaA isopeptide-forming pilin-related protein n=1 Tax=Enterococcus gallinarum TaxID=1353 RepID=UPI00255B0ED3